MTRYLISWLWDNAQALTTFKVCLDRVNVAILLLLAFCSPFLVLRFFGRPAKRYAELAAAILTPVLVATSAYMSPQVGDRITELKEAATAKELTGTQAEAKKANPESQPVTHVAISMKLVIKGKPPFPYLPQKKDPQGNIAHLGIGESAHWQPRKRGPWVLNLVAKDVECWSSTTEADYYAEFQKEPYFNLIDEPAGEFLKHVDFFDLFPNFIPLNTRIEGGTLTLKVNSSLSKTIPIPSQQFDLYHTIVDEWSLQHPSPWVELTPSP